MGPLEIKTQGNVKSVNLHVRLALEHQPSALVANKIAIHLSCIMEIVILDAQQVSLHHPMYLLSIAKNAILNAKSVKATLISVLPALVDNYYQHTITLV